MALVDRWESTRKAQQRAVADLERIKAELKEAETALGKWMTPTETVGCKPNTFGESFHIWIGNGLLGVSHVSENTYHVYWRQEPNGETRIG